MPMDNGYNYEVRSLWFVSAHVKKSVVIQYDIKSGM